MPRSFQSRMARKDQDRLRTDVMRGIRDQREEKNRVGPGIEMMGNVAISTPETRFNPEMDAAQRAREALNVERDTRMRGHDVTERGQTLTHQLGMRGQDVTAQGNRFMRDVGMRGHDVTERGQDINRDLGYAGLQSSERVGAMDRDARIGSSIIGALPQMTSERVDATGRLMPPPSIENIQRTAQGIRGAVYPQQEGATTSRAAEQAAPYSVTPEEARTTATNAFHSLGKRAGEIGQQVSSMFANPETLPDSLDKILRSSRYSRKEKEAITDLVQLGYGLGDTKMLDDLIADILGKK